MISRLPFLLLVPVSGHVANQVAVGGAAADLADPQAAGCRRAIQSDWGVLPEGLQLVWRRKTVLGAMSLDLFAVLFGGALLVQLETPDSIRGRVSAVNSVCISGAATLMVAFLWTRAFFPILWWLQTFEQLKEASTHET